MIMLLIVHDMESMMKYDDRLRIIDGMHYVYEVMVVDIEYALQMPPRRSRDGRGKGCGRGVGGQGNPTNKNSGICNDEFITDKFPPPPLPRLIGDIFIKQDPPKFSVAGSPIKTKIGCRLLRKCLSYCSN